jgi:hypothetical protein
MNSEPITVIEFFRDDPNGRTSCLVEVFEDGSAFIRGPGVGAIFEGSPEAAKHAVEYVESKGYRRVPGSGDVPGPSPDS